jgi:two-component system chemotaxis response regulator CheY
MARVLLVEDSDPIRALLTTTFKEAGYIVDAVVDGESALRKAATTAYTLVITDMSLPGIGGLELIRRIKALDLHHTTPLLVVAAMTRASVMREVQLAGADGLVMKPFKPEQVVQAARALLERPDMREPANG